jgi:hypothetical protein
MIVPELEALTPPERFHAFVGAAACDAVKNVAETTSMPTISRRPMHAALCLFIIDNILYVPFVHYKC